MFWEYGHTPTAHYVYAGSLQNMSTSGPLPAILGPPKEPPRKCSVLEPPKPESHLILLSLGNMVITEIYTELMAQYYLPLMNLCSQKY